MRSAPARWRWPAKRRNEDVNAKKILIIDDSPTELQMIAAPLRAQGYDVVTAMSGEEGLSKAAAERPTLILLDVVMPGKNGFQMCRILKQDPATKEMPIVFVTSKDQPQDRFWGMKQGADGYVAKPFTRETLLDAVQRLL